MLHTVPTKPMPAVAAKWDTPSKAENGCRGVIWAAPGESGRLEEPALARIVVCSARGFRAGVWSLFLPNPSWSAPAREAYMKARMAGDRDWKQLTRKSETLTGDPDTSQQHLAKTLWLQRSSARRSRGRRST
jgi:hypothetical protein